VIQSREFSTQWRSNAEGLRADRDFGPKKAGVTRVLVVGDSFTVGDQVRLEETYPGVMQSEFDRSYGAGRVEVLNAGFPGFGTIHERKWIEKFAARFEPDLVVVGSTPNDLLENARPILYEARDGALVDPQSTAGDQRMYEERKRWYSVPGWVARSLVMQRIRDLRIVERLKGEGGSVHARAFLVDLDAKIRAKAQTPRELYAVYEREIVLARDAAARCSAKFAVIAIPFEEQLHVAPPGQDFSLWGKRVAEIGARAGFPVIDLLPAFQAAGDPRALYWREDSHCRAAGYRLIGAVASAGLSAQGSAVALPALEPRAR
jgi:lysophospholipase L1-like esterase